MMTTSRSVVQTGKAVGKAAAQLNPDQTVTSQHVIKVQTLSFQFEPQRDDSTSEVGHH